MTLFASLTSSSPFARALLTATLLQGAFAPGLSAQNKIGLPPLEKPTTAAEAPRPETELQRFRRDLVEMQGSPPKVEARLQEMAIAYPAIESLIVQVARSARVNEMQNLMVVARRFGTPKVGDELLFQLLARPLGEATRATVETMALLQGDEAHKALQSCIRGRIAAVRRHATDVFVTMIEPTDFDFAMQLSGDQKLDLQLRGVDLLQALRDERSRARLIALLSKEPALASYACDALVGLGVDAAGDLQALCNQPPIDRGWAYAAFALAQIEQATGQLLLDPAWVPQLDRRLRDPEPLTRCLAAVALADLAYRSPADQAFSDVDIAEALLDVVEPQRFVANLDMLRLPCERRLLRLSGRIIGANQSLRWRDWWQTQRADFVGLRADVTVAPETAGRVIFTLRKDQRVARLLAEDYADLQPLQGAIEVLLTKEQVLALAGDLREAGFGDATRFREVSGLPATRSLQVQVGGARAQVAVSAAENLAFDALSKVIQDRLDAELWQMFRHPTDEPDRAAFWRAERRWREEHTDEVERGKRFARRVVRVWPQLSPVLRARGVAFLFDHPQRQGLLEEAEGEAILAMLRKGQEPDGFGFGDLELRLLELAAAVPGDKVWRECVDFAARSDASDNKAVRAVFAVLGPDAVLAALADERPAVRRVAIDEAVSVRDQRAGPRLVELLADADMAVQIKATQAVGVMQIEAAADPLIGIVVAEQTQPLLRREALRALGRVGGPKAFGVLERALAATAQEDKEAALRGLGELRDPRASHLLAELAVIGHGKDLGALARYYLQRQGGVLAVPALRHQLQLVTDQAIRGELVLLLGLYQDP
ncbi:MAG: HEAT repeat domain-containing protein, partial [Planctomycetes bacterium]|nr:HEAT repeat domain-containing protein [Planctomycetota bacterium]